MLSTDKILQGRYRIVSQIGQGGMSTVYEAQDKKRFDASVVVKEILIDSDDFIDSKQQEMLKRAFEREAKILAEVHHEVFPFVIEYFSESDRQYLVMELVEGANLAELLANQKAPFPLEKIIKWSFQLLDALDYLHSYNPPIFHSDLKPQNLKLSSQGKIKLLDFGIAKGAEEHMTATITNQTFIAATLNYSPFEQILQVLDPTLRDVITQRYEENTRRVLEHIPDAGSDLYSLGATLYHLSTAIIPTDTLKRTLEIWANKADPLRDLHELNPSIPEEISVVFLKAMEIERENRFASAVEMKQALNNAVADIKRRERETEKKRHVEVQHAIWLTEQKRLEHVPLGLENRIVKQDSVNVKAEQNRQVEPIDHQLQEPEIQRIYAEQERLRIEAKQVWLEQERHFAEQGRLQLEAESANQHQYEAKIQELISKQHASETQQKLAENDNLDELEATATTQFLDNLTQQSNRTEIFLEAPKQSVSSDILSEKTADLLFTSSQNHKTSWLSTLIVLIFLILGGVILGVWYLQTSKIEESSQTNTSLIDSNQTDSNQTNSNQTLSSSSIPNPEPTVEATPEINEEDPASTLILKPIVRPINRQSVIPKPVVLRMKNSTPQSRKKPPNPKKPVTIDDILNDQ
jgi:serine/threonine protein kinase